VYENPGTVYGIDPEWCTKTAGTRILLRLPDLTLEFDTHPGVFAYRAVDDGTTALLRHSPPPPDVAVLDLGCGYGPIAIVAALRAPGARVWAVDVDDLALELTEANAARLGATNVIACTPRQVPADLRFGALYSNPPVRIGKPAMKALVATWLDRLLPGADAYLVIKQSLGADSFARWLSASGRPTVRLASKHGYRVLCTTSPTPLTD